jgi:hypothetical protein
MASAAVFHASSRSQRMLAFRGVWLLVFGLAVGAMLLLALQVPDITTRLLIVLSVFVIVDVLARLFEAAGVTSQRGAWALLALTALIGLAAWGAIALRITRPNGRPVRFAVGGSALDLETVRGGDR